MKVNLSVKRNKKPPFGGKKSTIKLISSFMKLAEDFTKMPSLNRYYLALAS